MLSLLDRIVGFWPRARRLRAEKDVDPGDWYFRAHFFQDPVQPGSLGLEAMLQLIRCYLIHTGAAAADAVFEPWLGADAVAGPVSVEVPWPGHAVDGVVTIDVEITEHDADSRPTRSRTRGSASTEC